jgi:hypothetical protein
MWRRRERAGKKTPPEKREEEGREGCRGGRQRRSEPSLWRDAPIRMPSLTLLDIARPPCRKGEGLRLARREGGRKGRETARETRNYIASSDPLRQCHSESAENDKNGEEKKRARDSLPQTGVDGNSGRAKKPF